MPKVPPARTPSGNVVPMVDPTFMAMASFEYAAEARRQVPIFTPPENVAQDYNSGKYDSFESEVDSYTKGMKEGDKFRVMHPDGEPRLYKYLGPDSGGRKDWMELKSPGDS